MAKTTANITVKKDPKENNQRQPTRRQVLKYGLYGGLTASLGSSLWFSGCTKQGPAKTKPNIIFIVVDTLRADHLSCYGYQRNTTPNIDQLAGEGVLFRNAISAAPWTLPSAASFLTSQYPCVLGISNRAAMIPGEFPLLAELLKQQGYTTHGIVSHTMLSARLGFGRGFDSYDERSSLGHAGISAPAVTDKATSFLQKSHQKPFFLFQHYFDPHCDYHLHQQYNYYPSYKGNIRSGESIFSLWAKRQDMSEDDIKYLFALYDSEISFTDQYIGTLLNELKQQGLYDNSIIILTSDHGEEFMERGWIGHTSTLYQELLRVPLIIKFPDSGARIVDTPVGLIDLMPTLLAYLGLKNPDGLEGKALDIASGDPIASRPIFSETFNPQIHRPQPVVPIALRSVVLGDLKLIYDEKKGIKQIYDLSKDPYERNDLSSSQSDLHKALALSLAQYTDYVEKKRKKGPIKDERELFTPEQRKQLESLGYL